MTRGKAQLRLLPASAFELLRTATALIPLTSLSVPRSLSESSGLATNEMSL